MKTNIKILDTADPEVINTKLNKSDLDEITFLLQKKLSKESSKQVISLKSLPPQKIKHT